MAHLIRHHTAVLDEESFDELFFFFRKKHWFMSATVTSLLSQLKYLSHRSSGSVLKMGLFNPSSSFHGRRFNLQKTHALNRLTLNRSRLLLLRDRKREINRIALKLLSNRCVFSLRGSFPENSISRVTTTNGQLRVSRK